MHRFFVEFMVVLVGIMFIHQVCWPLIMGRKMFPIFRRERKLKAELSDIRQAVYEAELEEQVEAERNKLSNNQKDI